MKNSESTRNYFKKKEINTLKHTVLKRKNKIIKIFKSKEVLNNK